MGIMKLIPSNSQDIPLDKIVLGSSQARQRDTKVDPDDDLVRSIQKHGLFSPVVVKQLEDGKYELLIGQRRLRAHEILKQPTIKAYVVAQHIDDYTAKMLSLNENVARKGMKKADLVDAVQFFMEKYNSTGVVAEELGLSPGTVRRYLNAARLPEEIREDIHNKTYKLDHALKALQALGDDESTVDVNMLRDTALEMKKLSPQGQKKFVEIKKREPESSLSAVAEKAKQRTETHQIDLKVTDDQLERIGTYKKREEITEDGDAASELIDLGLDAADV